MHQDGTLNKTMNNAKTIEFLCQLESQIDRLEGYLHIELNRAEAAGLEVGESAFTVAQAPGHTTSMRPRTCQSNPPGSLTAAGRI